MCMLLRPLLRLVQGATIGAVLLLFLPPAAGQQDSGQPRTPAIIEFPNLGPVPGGAAPALGPAPGAFDADFGQPSSGVLGNRRRGARITRTGSQAGGASALAAPTPGWNVPEVLPAPTAEHHAALAIGDLLDPALVDDAGPEDGLTLDAAIERMLESNLDIRGLRQELPQADADIITAGLRSNPLIYMDSQFIPYGSFSDQRPGGPTQYDLNITYPVDASGKRQARTVVARIAKTALEAQYQDVVRRQIGNLYNAFVNLQAARLGSLAARAAIVRHEQRLAGARRAAVPATPAAADALDHAAFMAAQAQLALLDAEEAVADAEESLALLLGEPPESAERLAPRGGLRNPHPPPPPLEELTRIAIRCRPDIRSLRAGVSRARAEVDLQRANRFDDIYIFYDPITIQDNSPYGRSSATSWAVGLTFALPVYNRNQGNIARASANVQQTRLELSSMERRIASEVRLADREFHTSRRAIETLEQSLLPAARATTRRAAALFASGGISLEDYQSRLEEAADIGQRHRDALVRHRRAMLDLNTAVGLRLLP